MTGSTGALPPSNATDGDLGTRWASDWSDPQTLTVDLGSSQSFNHVQLAWEASYATHYQIQTSDDGNTWKTVYETSTVRVVTSG